MLVSSTPGTRLLNGLVLAHLAVICLSNVLVQHPVTLMGWHTTWGAFSFPLIFVLTDLTVRLTGQRLAYRVIWRAMLPALLLSCLLSTLFQPGPWTPETLLDMSWVSIRVAFASFGAYVCGQMLDAGLFGRLRRRGHAMLAPLLSTVFGNLLDTFVFFTIAFWGSSDPFMATHWVEIAWVDYAIKLVISGLLFLPLYGICLMLLTRLVRPGVPDTA